MSKMEKENMTSKQIPLFCRVSGKSNNRDFFTYIVVGTTHEPVMAEPTGGICLVVEGILLELPRSSVAELSKFLKEIEPKNEPQNPS